MSPWVTLCLISNCVNHTVAGFSNFAEDQWVWRKKTEIIETCQEPKFDIILQKLKMLSFGLQTYHLLHSCVGCTADVSGYHYQAARVEARHHRKQVDLEPQLKVFRPKFFKFRSKGCQGQVQDGVSYTWISDEGDVSLEIKGFTFQFRRTFLHYWNHCSESKLGDTALYFRASGASIKQSLVAIHSRSMTEMYPFEWNPGYLLLDSAKIHPPSGNFQEDSLPASFVLIYGILKVKHSPAWRSLQRPGKTHSTAHHQWTLSSLSTPSLRGSHSPKSRCLDPGSAQPSGLVRGSPQLPPVDTNQDDIWIALLFDMAKPQLCADFPSCEYCVAVFKKDW